MSQNPLLLSLLYSESYPEAVKLELEQLLGKLTKWANVLDFSAGNISLEGMGTFLGQPRCKIYKRTAQTIANDTDTVVTWDRAKTGSSLEEYDDSLMFDGSQYIVCSKPGLYVAIAEMEWTANGVGTRVVGVHPNISAVDYFAQDRRPADATVGPHHLCTTVFPVIANSPLGTTYVPFPLQVGVQVYQNSGGNLNIGGRNDRFGVWKVS